MKFYCRMDAAGSLQECFSQCAECVGKIDPLFLSILAPMRGPMITIPERPLQPPHKEEDPMERDDYLGELDDLAAAWERAAGDEHWHLSYGHGLKACAMQLREHLKNAAPQGQVDAGEVRNIEQSRRATGESQQARYNPAVAAPIYGPPPRTASVIVAAIRTASLTLHEQGEILGEIASRICMCIREYPELEETCHDLSQTHEAYLEAKDKISERLYRQHGPDKEERTFCEDEE